jgi:hypothetical protein
MRYLRLNRAAVQRASLIALLVSATIPVLATTRGPDAAGYTATDATVFSFADISGPGGGASVLGGADDATADLTLPFAFSFYGQSYTKICVSSNGALYFIADASACSGFVDFANSDLSQTSGPNDLPGIFPFWTDLSFQAGGAVVYQTQGVPGSRKFVVQWNKAYPFQSTNPVTFQVVFSEGSSSILVQYKTVDLGPGDAASKGAHATVGIRNHGAPANSQQIGWSFDAAVLADSTALLFGSNAFGSDATAPTTTSVLSGTAGSNGWYTSPVQDTLSATDPDSPVAGTFYAVDGGATIQYSVPFTISGDGVHHVSYSSKDPSGNQEPPHLADVKIDATPPSVTATATPSSLWPANGKMVSVTIRGTIADAASGSGLDVSSARFVVTDKYGQVQPTGSITLGAGGSYTATISLMASRNDSDLQGRTYTIAVSARDTAGNARSASTVVVVPHDQRK